MREAKVIPSPNLDDRTYQDIVDEAIRLIPHYCPDWTNHNPSDPGITLIELFAWMMEMVIYRLNRVPEKTYLTLLDLIGLNLIPPQAARVLLTFNPVEKYEGELVIKKGTQVSTSGGENDSSIIFETENDITVSNIELVDCLSVESGRITSNLGNNGFMLFSGRDSIERYIYVGDKSFEYLKDQNLINITFKALTEIKSQAQEIVNYLTWEYWNGKKWIPVDCLRHVPGKKAKDNEIYFQGPLQIESTIIDTEEGYFLRASLADLPEKKECLEIVDVCTNLMFHGQGLNPDMCFCNTDNMVYYELDLSKDFKPFMDIPKYNDAFYISSLEVFSKTHADIFIDFAINQDDTAAEPSENILLRYEYWNGHNWSGLGESTVKYKKDPSGTFDFLDTTRAFTQSGRISFKRPDDMAKCEVNSQENFWIRIRIGAGDFGTGGQYQLDEQGKWVWIHDNPLRVPMFNHIGMQYQAPKNPVNKLIPYFDFLYHDLSEQNLTHYSNRMDDPESKPEYFTILEINRELYPATYFGFSRKFPKKNFRIFYKLKEKKIHSTEKPKMLFEETENNLDSSRNIALKWEYWDGSKWSLLNVVDYTDSFHESGFVEVYTPDDFINKREFGKDLFWIRLLLEHGSFETCPKVEAIYLNSVNALNYQTHYDEIIGSSNGAPSQEFELLNSPLLPELSVMIKEHEIPSFIEKNILFSEEGNDAIEVVTNIDGEEEVWVRYHQVNNFSESTPKSRHYIVDYPNNKIIFGNGVQGIIPPRMKNNIMAKKYQTGGGTIGNVGAETVNILRENIPYITDVKNYYPAEGGSDLENLDNLKARAANVFKNCNRAVTADDYEFLAMESSASIAKARCLSKARKNGEVAVVILPKPDSDDFNIKQELYPTAELMRRVKLHLEARKLVGTKIVIEPPTYVKININISLVIKNNVREVQIIKDEIDFSIRRYLHPLLGGADGTGWSFGVPLLKKDIFNIIELVAGVQYIDDIEIFDLNTKMKIEKLLLSEDALISVDTINIFDKSKQF